MRGHGRYALPLFWSVAVHGVVIAAFLVALSAGLLRGRGDAFSETMAIDVVVVPDVSPTPLPTPSAQPDDAVTPQLTPEIVLSPLREPLPPVEPQEDVVAVIAAAPTPVARPPAPQVKSAPVRLPVRSAQAGLVPYSYHQQLLAHIERHKYYPAQARRKQIEGTVVVAFDMDVNGALRSYSLVRSAGHKILDEAALATIRNASPFPLPPAASMSRATLAFQVPVQFRLTR